MAIENEFGMGGTRSPNEYREGPVARKIERKTAKIPSNLFLWLAGGAVALSFIAQVVQPKRMAMFNLPTRGGQLSLFVGQWVPTLLLLGVYNKIVKGIGGSDQASAAVH